MVANRKTDQKKKKNLSRSD